VLLKGRFRPGQVIELAEGATAVIVAREAESTTLRIAGPWPFLELIERIGHMPLPPYLKREPGPDDHRWYQTIFADPKGSIAAPTAGLHFTTRLFEQLAERGVAKSAITLHVGPGTFLPVRVERIEDHRMLPEQYHVSEEAAQAIARTRSAGGRVVAVGTTVVRTLEAASASMGPGRATDGETGLFIVPGYVFRTVDALLTNFHLPRTTLAMLVAAFVGVEPLRDLYAVAVKERYRFYSYGDAMLIL
jgi:S-adenosylmethionine:tRNA ribosyltransferase-isomerase